MAAHGRLASEGQGALISAPEEMLREALKSEQVKNEIINRFIFDYLKYYN